MAVSLKDVARKAGVSVPTASLILNGRNLPFKESTRQAVFSAVESLSYRPDAIASRSARGRRDAVGLLIRSESASRVSNSPAYESICGINDVLMERQQFLVMVKVAQLKSGDDPAARPRIIAERLVDGLIVDSGLPPDLEAAVLRYGIPTVWLNSSHHDAFDCVYPDEVHAGRLVTRHLITLGHRNIMFDVPPPLAATVEPHFSTGERLRGYEQEMLEHDLEPLIVRVREASEITGEAVRLVVERRKSSHPVTAVVADFSEAIKVRHTLLERGLQCPRDISVATMEDVHIFRRSWPEMTGVSCNRYGMGRIAAEMMLTKIESGKPQPSYRLCGELYPGNTVLPLRAARGRKSAGKS